MKGMQKIRRGTGFHGLLEYLLSTADRPAPPQIIGGNMACDEPRALAREFGAVRQMRPDIKKPVWHNSLRLPAGERLSDADLATIADDYMRRMGFDDEQHSRIYVVHDDPEGLHLHIAACRVGGDGQVYLGRNENLISTRHIAALERDYGLTITRSTDTPAAVKAPKKGEMEAALARGEAPVRMQLQLAVDAALAGGCTAPEFVARLEAVGITSRPNIASTGRLNGFSFEINGVAFKGSQLGKSYTLKGLGKRGFGYDKDRDFAELRGRAGSAAAAGSAGDPGSPAADGAVAPGSGDGDIDGPAAAGGVVGPGGTLGAAAAVSGDPQPGDDRGRGNGDCPAHGDRPPDQPGDGRSAKSDGPHGQADRVARTAIAAVGRRREENRGAVGSDRGHGPTAGVDQADRGSLDRRVDRGSRSAGRDGWDARFRQASAARRRKRSADGSLGGGIPRGLLAAREIDPAAYLVQAGFSVEWQGRHASVRQGGHEVYRLTHRQDRGWLWCHHDGQGGGDNLDLVREIEQRQDLPLAEAIHRLDAAAGPCPVRPTVPAEPRRPSLPPQTAADVSAGRGYLRSRGIDRATITAAEQVGFLHYLDDAVVFVGRDDAGVMRSATRRAIRPDDPGPAKRDFAGSDKSFAPVLPGDPAEVWIVEGGADALAAQTMARRTGRRPATVIVSGGANVRSFLSSPAIREILAGAAMVTISRDREKSAEVQARVDQAHQAQARAVAEIIERPPATWRPPPEWKDLADLVADRGEKMITGGDYQVVDMLEAAASAAAIREQISQAVAQGADLAAIRFDGPAEFIERAERVRSSLAEARGRRDQRRPNRQGMGMG